MSDDDGGHTIDLRPAAWRLAAVVDGIRDEQLGDPTPCPDFTVGDLLDHVHLLSQAFRAVAAKADFPGLDAPPPPSTAGNLPADWRTAIPARLDELAAAWREPSAYEGMGRAGGVTMPNAVLGLVALDEIVVHGWDLARATGQDFDVDPAALDALIEFTGQFAADYDPETSPFGPPREVPDDAPAFDRVLGNTGRDPAWTPTAA